MAIQPSRSAAAPAMEQPAHSGSKSPNKPIDITDKNVAGLDLGTGLWQDLTMRGFYVICNAASKSFVYQRDVNGRAVRYNLWMPDGSRVPPRAIWDRNGRARILAPQELDAGSRGPSGVFDCNPSR
jgi:hypothetical protein